MTHTHIIVRFITFQILMIFFVTPTTLAVGAGGVGKKASTVSSTSVQTTRGARHAATGGADSGPGGGSLSFRQSQGQQRVIRSADGSGEPVEVLFGDPRGPASEVKPVAEPNMLGRALAASKGGQEKQSGVRKRGLKRGKLFFGLPGGARQLVASFAGHRGMQNLGLTNRRAFRTYVFDPGVGVIKPPRVRRKKRTRRHFVWRSNKEQSRIARASRKHKKHSSAVISKKTVLKPFASDDLKGQREVLALFTNDHFALDPIFSVKPIDISSWVRRIRDLPESFLKSHGFSEKRRTLLLDFMRSRSGFRNGSGSMTGPYAWHPRAVVENEAALALLDDFTGFSIFTPQIRARKQQLELMEAGIPEATVKELVPHYEIVEAGKLLEPFYKEQGTLEQKARFYGKLEYHRQMLGQKPKELAKLADYGKRLEVLREGNASYQTLKDAERQFLEQQHIRVAPDRDAFDAALAGAETAYTAMQEKADTYAARKFNEAKRKRGLEKARPIYHDAYAKKLKKWNAPLEVQAEWAGQAHHYTGSRSAVPLELDDVLSAQKAFDFTRLNGGAPLQIARAKGILAEKEWHGRPYYGEYAPSRAASLAKYKAQLEVLTDKKTRGTPEQVADVMSEIESLRGTKNIRAQLEFKARTKHGILEKDYKGKVTPLTLAEARAEVSLYNGKFGQTQRSYRDILHSEYLNSLGHFESMIKTLAGDTEPIHALERAKKPVTNAWNPGL